MVNSQPVLSFFDFSATKRLETDILEFEAQTTIPASDFETGTSFYVYSGYCWILIRPDNGYPFKYSLRIGNLEWESNTLLSLERLLYTEQYLSEADSVEFSSPEAVWSGTSVTLEQFQRSRELILDEELVTGLFGFVYDEVEEDISSVMVYAGRSVWIGVNEQADLHPVYQLIHPNGTTELSDDLQALERKLFQFYLKSVDF